MVRRGKLDAIVGDHHFAEGALIDVVLYLCYGAIGVCEETQVSGREIGPLSDFLNFNLLKMAYFDVYA